MWPLTDDEIESYNIKVSAISTKISFMPVVIVTMIAMSKIFMVML